MINLCYPCPFSVIRFYGHGRRTRTTIIPGIKKNNSLPNICVIIKLVLAMNIFTRHIWVIITLLMVSSGCAHHARIPEETVKNVYTVQEVSENPVTHFAPVFLTHDYRNAYNRIGQPSARYDEKGKEQIFVDDRNPATYYMVRKFSADRGDYTNYFYWVHFPEVPFSIIPFHLTSGRNMGLIVVVTVDSGNRPVLITTVHTCGCYLGIVPTSHLPQDALPSYWKEKPLKVYGENLPWILDYSEMKNPRVLVHLRPGVHRVMDLEMVEERDIHSSNGFHRIVTPLVHINKLEEIPVNGNTTSFYYKEGLLKGHVKGSVKVWETMLLSPVALDLFVGADKVYGDPEVTGNPFYTSLKPWNRTASEMWDFKRFLEFWGWRL